MAVCRAVLGTKTARAKKANEIVNAVMTSAPTSGGIVIPIRFARSSGARFADVAIDWRRHARNARPYSNALARFSLKNRGADVGTRDAIPHAGRCPMREATQAGYDVVVIGGGIGGLSCAALLAQAGRSVLAVEADTRLGGFAQNLTEAGYDFDLGLHVIMSLGSKGPFGQGMLHAVLEQLGVEAELEHVALDPFYAVRLEDEQVVLPGTRDAHLAALGELGSDDAQSIATLFSIYEQAYREIIAVPISLRLRDLLKMPVKTPLLFAKRKATLGQLLDAHIRDPKVRAVHTALWPYIGLPASQMAFLPFGAMMASYVGEGAYYCRGGFQTLADALANGLTRHGGELLLRTKVTRVGVRDRRVTGVELETGQWIEAATVISAGDVRDTFDQLIGHAGGTQAISSEASPTDAIPCRPAYSTWGPTST